MRTCLIAPAWIFCRTASLFSLRMVNQPLELDGEHIVGKKIGVTSKPVQDMLGVYQLDLLDIVLAGHHMPSKKIVTKKQRKK